MIEIDGGNRNPDQKHAIGPLSLSVSVSLSVDPPLMFFHPHHNHRLNTLLPLKLL